ncbi:SWIM zinc finger family protein [Streptomyces sp. NPDC004539]|uniref:SWIM zinc finger family protein n=1 Tax=Streptomyces sp. NPDC004539 TaxID=3154280 RepID=UPI0033BED22F
MRSAAAGAASASAGRAVGAGSSWAGESSGTREGSANPDAGPTVDVGPSTGPDAGSPGEPGPSAKPAVSAPRPADGAREALRAARARMREESEAAAQSGRKPGRVGPVPGNPVTGERVRDLKTWLAGAFRMPPEDEDEEGPETGRAPGTSYEVPDVDDVGEPEGDGRAVPAVDDFLAEATGVTDPPADSVRSAPGPDPTPLSDLLANWAQPSAARRPLTSPRTPEVPDTSEAPHTPEASPTSQVPPTSEMPPPLEVPHPSPPAHPPRHTPLTDPPPPSDPHTPQTPYIPRTMASPSRDGDLRRTFPALPSQDAPFARTWWGEAWVSALEGGALDAGRLLRGKGYAEGGRVDAITVTPGSVLAYVQGSRPRPYRVQVRLRTWEAADWESFLDAAVERPGQLAALLDKEVPPALAADCGVPLLPMAGELEPQCSCPDRGHPCKHAAALCYQTARLLDADPFVLLLLRGRGERDLLDTLARRSAAHAARTAQDRETDGLPGVRATEAIARRGGLPPLPAPSPPPRHPEQPPAYPSVPDGPDAFALDQLATDAAARAHALLTTGEDTIGGLTLWQDAVRLAAARPGSGLTATTRALYSSLAAATGRTSGDLARAVAAWRQGGIDGLAVLEDPWDPPAGRFDRARPLLLSTGHPAFRPWRNHLTHPAGHLQLRYGQDGLWYAYESEPGDENWWPRGEPAYDPIDALMTANPPEDL